MSIVKCGYAHLWHESLMQRYKGKPIKILASGIELAFMQSATSVLHNLPCTVIYCMPKCLFARLQMQL